MKWIIRLFFRTIRRIIGPIMLLIDKLTTPKGVSRPPEVQQQLDQTTQQLALYQFKTCPFCMKVRREIKRLSLNIELRDAQHDNHHREQLLQGGGQVKVPCLRIQQDDSEDNWVYESNDVIQYLRKLAA
jgi:glutaredoxin